jgi:integrase
MMAKIVPALNARQFAAWCSAKGAGELIDGAVPGLRVRRGLSGEVSWSLSVRLNGERRRIAVGIGLGLAEARVKAEEARRQVKVGVDPNAARREALARAQAAKTGLGTLGSVIETYFSTGDGQDLRSAKVQEDHLRTVFAVLLDRPALDVSVADLQSAIVAWSKRSVRAAQLASAYMRPVARWAEGLGLMKAGTDGLRAPKRRTAVKQAVLTAQEAGSLLRVLGSTGFDLAARLMLWTACRRSEVIGATWGEFDLTQGLWTISGSRRKDTRRRGMADLVVPLPRQAIETLVCIRDEHEDEAKDEARKDQLVLAGARGAALTQNWPRWSKKTAARAGIGSVSPHALRRTAATLLGELGEPPHITEVVLGHAAIGSRLSSGYNQSRYAREHREALQRLADHLDALARGENKVVPMRRTA